MTPLIAILLATIPLCFVLFLQLGWQPHIQQIADYLVGKGLALILGGYGMWLFVTKFDKHTAGSWFEKITESAMAVAVVTAAIIVAFGLIVAWS